MINDDIEKHHIIFAIVSIIISIAVTLLIKSLTAPFTSAWIAILIDYIVLICFVKVGSILFTVWFFEIVNGKKPYTPKNPLRFADFDLSSAIIITGVIFMEYYNYIRLYIPSITSDYIYPAILILVLIPSIFMVTYGIIKNTYHP
ncbi:MAG: hypothetical protein WC884_04295 [Candidatus Paceibacterota bacterium]